MTDRISPFLTHVFLQYLTNHDGSVYYSGGATTGRVRPHDLAERSTIQIKSYQISINVLYIFCSTNNLYMA